jgi:hypothetical protein
MWHACLLSEVEVDYRNDVWVSIAGGLSSAPRRVKLGIFSFKLDNSVLSLFRISTSEFVRSTVTKRSSISIATVRDATSIKRL